MTILEKIIANKLKEVEAKKKILPLSILEKTPLFGRETFSMAAALKNSTTGIIAEFKRRSPSKSEINSQVLVEDVVKGYEGAGVCGISVLTDTHFFGGSLDDLALTRNCVAKPILRKDFIVDIHQIYEAKAFGADVILLIAASLSESKLKEYSTVAKNLGLEVLLEIHNEEELQKSMLQTVDIIGVNNRNLKTFEVSIENSMKLSELIPKQFVKISESGISDVNSILQLKKHGFQGFLVGETFMKTDNPGKAAKAFITQL